MKGGLQPAEAAPTVFVGGKMSGQNSTLEMLQKNLQLVTQTGDLLKNQNDGLQKKCTMFDVEIRQLQGELQKQQELLAKEVKRNEEAWAAYNAGQQQQPEAQQ